MYDTTILRTKTATRLILLIEDLLEILPKELKCPEVLHAKTAIRTHTRVTKQRYGMIKPAHTRKKRIENILNYENLDDRYDIKVTSGKIVPTGRCREEKDIISKAARL